MNILFYKYLWYIYAKFAIAVSQQNNFMNAIYKLKNTRLVQNQIYLNVNFVDKNLYIVRVCPNTVQTAVQDRTTKRK